MAQHGGYRKPTNPAAVSGPGAHSARTDGQVISTAPDQAYGDAKQQALQQQTAPMGAATPLPPAPSISGPAAGDSGPPSGNPNQYMAGGFADPTNRPEEPVTHGVPIGMGAGSEALSLGPAAANSIAPAQGSMTKLLTNLSGTDTTGVLAQLLQAASASGA